MRKVLISILLITLVVNCFSFVVFAEENDEPAIDVVFIMDLSGSMNYADSEKVSLTSVSIFADLLENSSSQIGYVTFSTNVIESMPLTPVTHARSRIRNNLMTSGFDGQTNIPDALDDALRLFNSTTSTNQRVAILFTDGNIVMPSSSGLNQQQGEERCRNTARAFGDAGIPLYTIGLNFDGSLNMKFLQDLAELSSSPGNAARDYEAKTNWDIPEIFSKIYISLFNGNADVSLNFDASEGVQIANFYADEDIYELNILLIHNNALEDLEIRMPGGGEYRETTFQQREQDGYSFVKIRYPDVGNWEFSFRGDYVSANRLVRYITVRPPVNITFNTDGGTELEVMRVPLGRYEIPIPRKEGFSFEGWYLNEARTRPLPNNYLFTNDTQLYAKWIPPVLRTVTFVGNGVADQSLEVEDGDRFYNHLPLPGRKGYTFIGWFGEDGEEVDRNAFIDNDVVLVAEWEKIELNLVFSILIFIFAAIIFVLGLIFGGGKILSSKRAFEESNEKSARLCAFISSLFCLVFTLGCWSFLKEYIIPIEILSSEPSKNLIGTSTFAEAIETFALFGGLLVPFVLNVLLAAVLPLIFVSPASKFGKEKQYLMHLIITGGGLLWPVGLWILFGAGTSMLWLLIFAFVVYSINFFLSALLFKQGRGSTCTLFFFDV